MQIEIICGSWAERRLGAREKTLVLDKPATVLEAALAAGLTLEDIGMIAVEDCRVEFDMPVSDGMKLRVYPPIMGG